MTGSEQNNKWENLKDWICPKCNQSNVWHRSMCICGAGKPLETKIDENEDKKDKLAVE